VPRLLLPGGGAGTDPTDLDGYLSWYSTMDDLVAAVSLDTAQRHAIAADQLARFRDRRSGNPFAEIFAPWLDRSGTAGAPVGTSPGSGILSNRPGDR